MSLQSKFIKFMTEYRTVFEKVWKTGIFKDDFGNFVRHDIADELGSIAHSYNSVYSSKGSVGQTKWTPVPWLAIFDNRITRKATEGEYVVYLLNSETKELYLTFNQASEEKNNAEVRRRLQEKARQIRSRISFPSGVSFEPIYSGNAAYDAGCICSVKYSLGAVPDDSVLNKDLSTFLDIYSQYYNVFFEESDNSEINPLDEEEHKTGKFDSWEIIDETTAVKTCDKSFFEYNGSGVPKEICWFFDAEDLSSGETKAIKVIYNGEEYAGKVANDTTDRRRVRIFWSADLGRLFDTYKNTESKATFVKKQTGVYEITFKGGEEEMTIKEQVAAIRKYIEAKGFNYDGSLIENFYLGLKSKPFVILAGTSGTGKTRLVRLFAEAIKANYKLVSVRPDWSDSSDLFGHVDLNQKFVPGAIIDFVKQAELNPTKPYFLCLDEMNLARVEYYMSDILSAIETRRYENGLIITDPVVSSANYGNDSHAPGRYGKVILPGNLYIVGTVNMDETTFPFSKKVLDRSNTIEFSYVDLLSMPSFSTATADKITVTNELLVSKYITLNDCDAADREYIGSVCTTLSRINGILEIANAHIGYRVRDEIVFYMLNNREADLLNEKAAFDNQIMQKILPRIQGSSESIKTMLGELLKICESEKYEASAKKINFMIKRYEEDGFTSYWL